MRTRRGFEAEDLLVSWETHMHTHWPCALVGNAKVYHNVPFSRPSDPVRAQHLRSANVLKLFSPFLSFPHEPHLSPFVFLLPMSGS